VDQRAPRNGRYDARTTKGIPDMIVRGGMKAAAVSVCVAVSAWGADAAAADAKAGADVFKTECGICHSIKPGKNVVGPSLFGVVGRVSGTAPRFHYSQANINAHITWTQDKLDGYLKDPATTLPGTTMGYAGLADDAQRANVIAYLATLK
jgi:cytochrome c